MGKNKKVKCGYKKIKSSTLKLLARLENTE